MHHTLSTVDSPPRESSSTQPTVTAAWPAWSWAFVGAVLILHAVLAWLSRPGGMLTGQDDAVYIMLARGIRSLQYHDLYALGAPRHGLYPPGYPLLLSVWGLFTGDTYGGFIALNVLLSTGGVFFSWLVLRTLLPSAVALAALLAIAVNPHLVHHAGTVVSEAPYLFITMLAVWLASRADETKRSIVLLGAVVLFASLTRAVGITLVGGLGLLWLVRGEWRRTLGLAAVALLVLGPWLVWISTAPAMYAGSSYVADAFYAGEAAPSMLSVFAARVSENIPQYFVRSIPFALTVPTVEGVPIDNAISALLITGSLIYGGWLLWRRRRLEAFYLACAFALLLVWPWSIRRFLHPLLPLILAAVLLGLTSAGTRFGARKAAIAPLLLALTLTASGLVQSVALVRTGLACQRGGDLPHPSCLTPDQASFFDALRYIQAELPADAVIVSAKEGPVWHYTGRLTFPAIYAVQAGSAGIVGVLRENRVEYVLLGSLNAVEPGPLLDALENNCEAVDLEREFPLRTLLLRVRPESAPDQSSAACEALSRYRRLHVNRDFREDT